MEKWKRETTRTVVCHEHVGRLQVAVHHLQRVHVGHDLLAEGFRRLHGVLCGGMLGFMLGFMLFFMLGFMLGVKRGVVGGAGAIAATSTG